MLTFMFPGQGSQVRGMGAALFDHVPEFTAIESDIDNMLGFSVRRVCLEDPGGMLRDTRYTQPCLYVVNALHYFAEMERGESPSFVVGHSLGEYNALLAAGVFDFWTGLQLVKRRAALMAEAKGGGMVAVVGLDAARIEALLRDEGLNDVDIANYNAPAQIVLSGPVESVKRASPLLEKSGARMCMPLAVSAAFHSRYMRPASEAFAAYLGSFNFGSPRIPVIANVTARPYPTQESSSICVLLAQQIDHSVRWVQSVEFLLQKGTTEFKELGPGAVLKRLVQQVQAESVVAA